MESVSLIIVNFNSESHILSTLAQLASMPHEIPKEVIVVDNSPENGLSQQLAGLNLQIIYQKSQHNLGFAGGVNLGLEQSNGKYIILLNPDAYPEKNCLSGLIKVLTDHSDIAVAAPVLLSLEDEPKPTISATKCDPSILSILFEYTALHRFVTQNWLDENYFISPISDKSLIDCANVQGACFAFKRSWLDKVGPFDSDSFFLYWEETDFCRRIRNLAGRIVYCTQLACRHQGGASVKEGNQDVHNFWRSLYAYQAKHRGPLAAFILRLLLIPGIGTELLILIMLSQFRHKGDQQLDLHVRRMQSIFFEQFRSHKI